MTAEVEPEYLELGLEGLALGKAVGIVDAVARLGHAVSGVARARRSAAKEVALARLAVGRGSHPIGEGRIQRAEHRAAVVAAGVEGAGHDDSFPCGAAH